MKRVLLTDGEERSTLAVTRSLGAAGYRVEVASRTGRSLAGASGYCVADHRAPAASDGPREFLDHFQRLVEARNIDVFLPMTDVSASVGLGLRDRCPNLIIPFPKERVWADASDKARLAEVAGELGVPVPRQVRLESKTLGSDAACDFASRTGYPVVVKPHRSAVVLPRRVEKFGVRLADNADELRAALEDLPPCAYPVLVQERIRGQGLGGFFLCADGATVAAFAHRRLREKPPTGGVSVLRESVPLRDDVRSYSEALLAHLRWSGVAMVEFKEDSATGTPYLMEINGRFWGSLQLAIDAGVDFPAMLLDVFAPRSDGARSRPPAAYATGVRSRWLWGEVDHFIALARMSAVDRHRAGFRGGFGTVLEGLRLALQPHDRQEVFRASDLRPFLVETVEWVRSLGRG